MSRQQTALVEAPFQTELEANTAEAVRELPELTGSALVFGKSPEVEAKVVPSATCRVVL
jgi:hypothetical protein